MMDAAAVANHPDRGDPRCKPGSAISLARRSPFRGPARLAMGLALTACAAKAGRPPAGAVDAGDAGGGTGEVTVQVLGPAPVAQASVLLVRDSENGGEIRAPDATGSAVFRAVSPGFYRVEVRHPRGLAERRDVPVDPGTAAVVPVGLKSAFLYQPEPGPQSARYRAALAALFARWKGGQMLGSVTVRPAVHDTEALVGVARRPPDQHLAVALHADARVIDTLSKEQALARAVDDAERRQLDRLPSLATIALRPSTRPIPAALARAVVCTWQASVARAVPEREAALEVVDAVRYTVQVRDPDGQPRSADTEALEGQFLDSGPRLRALRLMDALHAFADGHLSLLQLERSIDEHRDPGC
jgi:hypothetical protein